MDSRAIRTGSASWAESALSTATYTIWCSAYSYRPILLLCLQLQTYPPALPTATDPSSCSAYSYTPLL